MRAEHLVHRRLHDAVDDIRDAKASFPAAALWDPYPPDHADAVRPIEPRSVQRRHHIVEDVADLIDALTINTGGAVVSRDVRERTPQVHLTRKLFHRHRRQDAAVRVRRQRHRRRAERARPVPFGVDSM